MYHTLFCEIIEREYPISINQALSEFGIGNNGVNRLLYIMYLTNLLYSKHVFKYIKENPDPEVLNNIHKFMDKINKEDMKLLNDYFDILYPISGEYYLFVRELSEYQ